LGVQLAHDLADARQAAEIERAVLLIDEAAGADLDHDHQPLLLWLRARRHCE
jgi:ABC-type hemin transport system ATPase subunit